MSFIEKHDPVILSIKLTNEGRKKISEGEFKVAKISLGDSEIDYEFIRNNNYNYIDCSILSPMDKNPNIISHIKRNPNSDKYILNPNLSSSSYTIDNNAIERGFFSNITKDDADVNTTSEYVRQHNCVIRLKELTGNNSLRIGRGSGLTLTVEPSVGDYIMIRWNNPNTTINNKIEFNKPHPILFYKIESIVSGKLINNNLIVTVDRNLPNYTSYNGNKEALAIIYPTNYNYFNYKSTNFLNEAIFAFFENYNTPTHSIPIWNMSLIFKNDIIGVNNTLKSFSKSNSASYTGFLNYIQNHTNNINMVGIIHFTNQSPSNDYGEGFYLDTPKIKLPTIMWHKSEKMGLILKADSNEHYINGLNISYRNLINDEGYVFGKVFNNLKLFVIEDAELLFAMSYKSNRNWTLPKINSDINSNIMFSDTPVCNLLYTMIVQQPQSISNQIGSITISNIIPTSDTADVIAILTNTSNNTQKTISSTFNNNYNNIVFDNLTPATYSLQVIDLTTTNCIKTETIIINQLSSTLTLLDVELIKI